MDVGMSDLNELLSIFVRAIDDRSDTFVVYNEALINYFLKWQLITWKNQIGNRKPESDNFNWFLLHEQTNQGLRKIGRRCIAAKQYMFSTYFVQNYCSFMERHKNEEEVVDKKTVMFVDYSYNLFFDLITEFITTVGKAERDYFWDKFSLEWRITETNLLEDKVFANLAFRDFLQWSQSRILSQKQEYDLQLHYMIKGLFPEVNSRVWETIILFIFTPYNPEARVKSVIERFWPVGRFSAEDSVFGYTVKPGENEEEVIKREKEKLDKTVQNGEKKAFELAGKLFSEVFSDDNLNKFIAEAEKLKYPDGSQNELQRIQLLKVFRGIAVGSKK